MDEDKKFDKMSRVKEMGQSKMMELMNAMKEDEVQRYNDGYFDMEDEQR